MFQPLRSENVKFFHPLCSAAVKVCLTPCNFTDQCFISYVRQIMSNSSFIYAVKVCLTLCNCLNVSSSMFCTRQTLPSAMLCNWNESMFLPLWSANVKFFLPLWSAAIRSCFTLCNCPNVSSSKFCTRQTLPYSVLCWLSPWHMARGPVRQQVGYSRAHPHAPLA